MIDPELKGRRAVVTGGASGIGQAIALGLAYEGTEVVIIDRVGADDTLAAAQAHGTQAHSLTVDLSVRRDAEEAVRQAVDLMHGLDIVVNAAGVTRHESVTQLTDDGWRTAIDTNLAACAWVCRMAAHEFIAQHSGTILVIGSTVIHNPAYRELSYRVSKVGLRALVETFAVELACHGVRVNMLSPGAVASRLVEQLPAEIRSRTVNEIPLRREATPNEIVPTALLLLSDRLSPYTTGAEVLVDGGIHLRPMPILTDADLFALNPGSTGRSRPC